MNSTPTPLPPPDPAAATAPATTPASVKISGRAAILILLAIPLAILILWKSYPLNLWFGGCLILWIIPQDERFKDKPWAALLKSLTGPALSALAILTTFVAALTLFNVRDAGVLANWEDRIILHLHSWLRYPTKWQYVGILAVVTLVSWRFPRLKAVGRVKTAKEWLGTAAGITGVIANVSFLGQQKVVNTRYDDVQFRIEVAYRDADKEKIRHLDRALAVEALAQDLQSADPPARASLHNSFAALAALDLPHRYQDDLAFDLAAQVTPPLTNGIEAEADLDGHAYKDAEAALANATPDQKIAQVDKVRQDAAEARHQQSDAEAGLRTIISTIVGSQNGKLADAAMGLFEPIIHKISIEALAPVTDALQDQASDSIKDWLKVREKPIIDQLVAQSVKTLHWDELPHSSPEQIQADLGHQAVQLASDRRNEAASTLKSIETEAQSSNADPDDLAKNIDAAKTEGTEADQVLGKLGANHASSSQPAQGPAPSSVQDPSVAWDRAAKPAQEAVAHLQTAHAQEEKKSEMKEHPVEP